MTDYQYGFLWGFIAGAGVVLVTAMLTDEPAPSPPEIARESIAQGLMKRCAAYGYGFAYVSGPDPDDVLWVCTDSGGGPNGE